MPRFHLIILLLVAVGMASCSQDFLRRMGFETLESAGQQQCRELPDADCPARERYEDYEKQRQAL